MCGERTGESGGWGVTSELLGGWCCAWRVHEDPTHRSGMAMPSRVPRGSPLTCGHASGDHVSEIQWSGGRRLNRHEPGGWVWSCPVGRGLSGRMWRVGQRPGMRDLSHRIVRELVVQRPGMRGGRSCPAGRRGGGCIRRGQAGYPYGRPVWCRSADRTFGGGRCRAGDPCR